MSSNYRRICLNHNPVLIIDEDNDVELAVPPPISDRHPHCKLALGRYSGSLTEVWLPIPYYDKDGSHAGRWYDVSWVSRFPQLLSGEDLGQWANAQD